MSRAVNLFGRAIRETGQAMDRLGLLISGNLTYKETLSRHRQVMAVFDKVGSHSFVEVVIIILLRV
jgi:hypothetical protein